MHYAVFITTIDHSTWLQTYMWLNGLLPAACDNGKYQQHNIVKCVKQRY